MPYELFNGSRKNLDVRVHEHDDLGVALLGNVKSGLRTAGPETRAFHLDFFALAGELCRKRTTRVNDQWHKLNALLAMERRETHGQLRLLVKGWNNGEDARKSRHGRCGTWYRGQAFRSL